MVVYHDRNLIINYIPRTVSDVDLSNLFASVGAIKSCRIIRDRSSGSSFGFGFCEYEEADAAHRAIARFNGYRIADKVLKVSLAKLQGKLSQSSNLYVKNFPLSVTEEQLASEFGRFGKVLQCRILRDRDTDASKGSAYVLFENRCDAEAARKSLDCAPWPGGSESQTISIKFATPPYRQPSGNGSINKNKYPRKPTATNNVGNENYGDQLAAQLLAAQSRFGAAYDPFGHANPPYIQENVYSSPNQNMAGTLFQPSIPIQPQSSPCSVLWSPEYGTTESQPVVTAPVPLAPAYVSPYCFAQNPLLMNLWSSFQPSVMQALSPLYAAQLEGFSNAMQGCPVFTGLPNPLFSPNDNSNLSVLHNSTVALAPSDNVGKKTSFAKGDKTNSASVYVYNIGNLMTERQLWELFSPFGIISSVSIPKDPKTNFARNFGFITFNSVQSAQNAIHTMNGWTYSGRRLQVSFRKPRSNNRANKLAEHSTEGGITENNEIRDQTQSEDKRQCGLNGEGLQSASDLCADRISAITIDDSPGAQPSSTGDQS
ncbi:unnamed protein product [Calicophoron daubneyi]|uniref:RRM domain-containing protein n=1 Tax=Calicophoron daubneyi TaxID=300641 RepID=A0AAV2TGW8_CALDB